jgi:hypothetical protein
MGEEGQDRWEMSYDSKERGANRRTHVDGQLAQIGIELTRATTSVFPPS